MTGDRKRIKKIREKRAMSIKKLIKKHRDKIKTERGRKDTTKDYWQKEIDEKFLKQFEKDEEYLENEYRNKKNS